MNRREIMIGSAGLVGTSNIFLGDAALASAAKAGEPPANWYEQARFGMFIHWGLYSQLAGEWRGKRYFGSGEWIMYRGKIPVSECENVAHEFNPVKFSAASWVRVAKAAGVKYIVITAKHHEGFAMFGSKASKYNIVDATPYKHDPLLDLCNAARSEGLKIGFYYSQVIDWHEKDAVGNDWDFPQEGRDFSKYLETKARPQIVELLTNYGPIDIVWFDQPGDSALKDSQDLYDLVKAHQPNCLVSSRIGNGLGDFRNFGDSELPPKVSPGKPWESIFTHNDTWGYIKYDKNFKSKLEILEFILEVASKGGNLMLNIGPRGDGSLPEESIDLFLGVGDWLHRYGQSIYGTQGVDLCPAGWGVATKRSGRLYLLVMNVPDDNKLLVPGFTGHIDGVRYMGGANLKWHVNGNDLTVFLSEQTKFHEPIVIEVQTPNGGLRNLEYCAVISRKYSEASLVPAQAELSGGAITRLITFDQYFGDWKHFPAIEGLSDEESCISWNLRFAEPGKYRIALEYAAEKTSEGNEGYVLFSGETYLFQTLCTEGGGKGTAGAPNSEEVWDDPVIPIIHKIAVISVKKEGLHTIKIGRIGKGSNLFHLKRMIITPFI